MALPATLLCAPARAGRETAPAPRGRRLAVVEMADTCGSRAERLRRSACSSRADGRGLEARRQLGYACERRGCRKRPESARRHRDGLNQPGARDLPAMLKHLSPPTRPSTSRAMRTSRVPGPAVRATTRTAAAAESTSHGSRGRMMPRESASAGQRRRGSCQRHAGEGCTAPAAPRRTAPQDDDAVHRPSRRGCWTPFTVTAELLVADRAQGLQDAFSTVSSLPACLRLLAGSIASATPDLALSFTHCCNPLRNPPPALCKPVSKLCSGAPAA
ncbi:hypothetical protein PSPO01_01197 [Paraphaeosphaeria sporulosa]